MATPTPTPANTYRGWGELYYVTSAGEPLVETEHLIVAGKATITRSFSVDKHTSSFGTSFATVRSDLTEVAEEIKIETDEITDQVKCIAFGVALDTALTTAQNVTGTVTRKEDLRLKLFDLQDSTHPKLVRSGFTGTLTLDGDISMGKDGVSTATVKVDVEGTFGTILGYVTT